MWLRKLKFYYFPLSNYYVLHIIDQLGAFLIIRFGVHTSLCENYGNLLSHFNKIS